VLQQLRLAAAAKLGPTIGLIVHQLVLSLIVKAIHSRAINWYRQISLVAYLLVTIDYWYIKDSLHIGTICFPEVYNEMFIKLSNVHFTITQGTVGGIKTHWYVHSFRFVMFMSKINFVNPAPFYTPHSCHSFLKTGITCGLYVQIYGNILLA